jgi:CubicO group peptidase (beta-lactamase class C family)/rhamnogalacturonyl hydrolase YesR
MLKAVVLASLSVAAVCSAQSGVADRQQPDGALGKVIQPYLDEHEIAGAVVLIANRDRVIDREVAGYADIAGHRLMKVDDLFWIASMSKAMTASAVMMLEDEGKLSLDDPVEKYLPEFKSQMVSIAPDSSAIQTAGTQAAADKNTAPKLEPSKHPITIREILSHTAGLPFSSKRETGALDLLPLKTAVESYAAEPLQSQPGTKYSYSNEGINTAGRIVEVVSGMPYEEFMQTRLFTPLGMNDTTFWPSGQQLERLAKSYQGGSLHEGPVDQLTYPLSDRTRRYPMPAGGLFSTAHDVVLFCQMMLNEGTFNGRRYLSPMAVRLITTKETGDAVTTRYGFGWTLGDGFFEHSGAYKTDMKVDTQRGLIVVFMVQHSNDWNGDERKRLMDSLEDTAIPARSTAFSTAGSQMVSPHGIPTFAKISAEEQAGIDEDIARHLGDVSADPGPKANLSPSTSPTAVHAAMRLVADWELQKAQPYLTQNWTWSVLDTGFMAASRELGDPRYSDAMLAMAEKFHWEMGAEDPASRGWPDNNDQALAQTYLELYFLDPAPEKLLPTQKALDSLFNAKMPPVPDGQFPIWWQWCDTLFMGPPTWARMAAATHDAKYLDYLDKRWSETSGALYDPNYHLLYRDKTFIGRTGAAGKPIFWSRGNGWVMGGLARTLEYMPADYPGRKRYETQLREMAAEFKSIQDPNDGLWHADLLDAADYPQPELSGSALITFGLAWGVNHGVLDRATYEPVVAKAWSGMLNEVYADGRLGNVQQTDGAPNYYMPSSSFNFGVGGFLLAGEQVARLSHAQR